MINNVFGVTAWLLSVLVVGLPSLLVPVAHANDTHAQLELAVQEFLLQELATAERTTTLVPPYSQATVSMTLPPAGLPCDNPQLSLPNRQQRFLGRVSVAATCAENPQLVRYLQANIELIGEVVVARQDIATGQLITAELLTTEQMDLSRASQQSVYAVSELIGQVSRRQIRSGQPMQSHMVHQPPVIQRGQIVVIRAEGNGFSVSREGEALENGAIGESIRIRVGQREIIHARVTGPGQARVQL
ncbi:MAG: flagellar basal body P-ring formation chaperone FlgA [Gammaproteobacteria bacterium]|nr:flagellar basal body P-ring formation chaperone FlgA [Gammaproteobacteria bacterium]